MRKRERERERERERGERETERERERERDTDRQTDRQRWQLCDCARHSMQNNVTHLSKLAGDIFWAF